MTPPETIPAVGRILIFAGLLLAALLAFGGRLPLLGRLPGDLVFGKGNVRIFLPLTTSVLLSIILTLILNLISWLRR